MNGYELLLFIGLTVLSIMLVYMINKTEKLEDTVTDLHSYINATLDPQIKTIRKLVADEIINKNGDTSLRIQLSQEKDAKPYCQCFDMKNDIVYSCMSKESCKKCHDRNWR